MSRTKRALQPASEPRVPRPERPIVGRSTELRALSAALRRHRVVLLRGPPGVGKTRLAIELASRSRLRSWFADLAPARSAEDVLQALAQALGVRLDGPVHGWTAALARAIGAAPALLVVDNCEQVAAAVHGAAATLIPACPGTTLLLTSRTPVGLAGEHVVELPPLGEDDAADLFARAAGTGATDTVRRLVRALDGLPLAIEMAAARVRVLSPEALLMRLGARMRLLKADDGPWGSLREAIAWSWDLASPAAQTTLAACAAFRAPFDADQAEAIAGPEVLDALDELVRSSLLQREEVGGEVRFRLLEAIRDFALEHAPADLADRHARVMVSRWAAIPERDSYVAEEREIARMALDRADLDAAGRHLVEQDPEAAATVVKILTPLVRARGPVALHEALISAVLERPVALRTALDLLRLRAAVRYLLGAYDRAVADLERVGALARELGSPAAEASALHNLAHVLGDAGRTREAEEALRRAVPLADRSGQATLRGTVRAGLASLLMLTERVDVARVHLEEAARRFEESGSVLGRANVLLELGQIHLVDGRPSEALAACDTALALLEGQGTPSTLGRALRIRGYVAACLGRYDESVRDLELALGAVRALGDRTSIGSTLRKLAETVLAKGDVARAEALAREAVATDDALGHVRAAAWSRSALALALWAAGRAAEALDAATTSSRALQGQGLPPQAEAVLIEAALGPAEAARDVLIELRDSLGPHDLTYFEAIRAVATSRGVSIDLPPPTDTPPHARGADRAAPRARPHRRHRDRRPLVAMGAPAPWQAVARELWRDDPHEHKLRKRWDAALGRLRDQLRTHGLRSDLVRVDRHGNVELVLADGERAVDAT